MTYAQKQVVNCVLNGTLSGLEATFQRKPADLEDPDVDAMLDETIDLEGLQRKARLVEYLFVFIGSVAFQDAKMLGTDCLTSLSVFFFGGYTSRTESRNKVPGKIS